jgi:hypothetical protein
MEPATAPEIVAVIPRPAHTVRIVFADGEVRDVDITPLLDTPAFSPLRESAIFEQVEVDEDTGTIGWPGDVDLDPDVIYAALDLGPDKAQIHVLAPAQTSCPHPLQAQSKPRRRALTRPRCRRSSRCAYPVARHSRSSSTASSTNCFASTKPTRSTPRHQQLSVGRRIIRRDPASSGES